MNTNSLPGCKDCKWFSATRFHGFCSQPEIQDSRINYRNGTHYSVPIVIQVARGLDNLCGPDAKLFEQREPTWIEKIFKCKGLQS